MAGGSDSMMGSGDVTIDSVKEHMQYVLLDNVCDELKLLVMMCRLTCLHSLLIHL